MFAAFCMLCVVCCLLFGVRDSLFVVWCLAVAGCCLLFVACCLLLVCLLVVVCCVSFVVGCCVVRLWFVVCRFDVCCWCWVV